MWCILWNLIFWIVDILRLLLVIFKNIDLLYYKYGIFGYDCIVKVDVSVIKDVINMLVWIIFYCFNVLVV